MAVGRQLASDTTQSDEREIQACAGPMTKNGEGGTADRKTREKDLRVGLALAGQMRSDLGDWAQSEHSWSSQALPRIHRAFAGAAFTAQQAEQLRTSQQILSSPERRAELTASFGAVLIGGSGVSPPPITSRPVSASLGASASPGGEGGEGGGMAACSAGRLSGASSSAATAGRSYEIADGDTGARQQLAIGRYMERALPRGPVPTGTVGTVGTGLPQPSEEISLDETASHIQHQGVCSSTFLRV
jgi:hypothetical protein